MKSGLTEPRSYLYARRQKDTDYHHVFTSIFRSAFCLYINRFYSSVNREFYHYTSKRSSLTQELMYQRTRFLNPLSANPTKWSNTLKQFAGKLPTNCLSVFDHIVKLAPKGLILNEY